MVIEYNNNRPTQSNLVLLNQHYFLKVETDFCVQSYISSDMRDFVLLLEITTIQMLSFFTAFYRTPNMKQKLETVSTSRLRIFRAIYFFQC